MSKTCVITGAGSGIGRATAVALSQVSDFQNLVLIGRQEGNLAETIKMMNPQVKNRGIVYDLEELSGISGLVDGIFNEFGRIDCLMNIAGYADPQPLLSTQVDNLEKTYRVNVFAPVELIRNVTKYMKQQKEGKILNLASTAGCSPRAGWLSYSSSKAALISISETLSEELAEYGIAVYCVSPGRCATQLREKLAPNEDPSTIMQADEVAEILVRLVSQEEKCLDGQNIIIRRR